MPYPLFMVEVQEIDGWPREMQAGQCWFAPWLLRDEHKDCLSPKYWAQWAAIRPPLYVTLPNLDVFCVDSYAREGGKKLGSGWDVSGTAPILTISPSINIVGYYHGWIRDGIITDDCEGRQFDARGARIK